MSQKISQLSEVLTIDTGAYIPIQDGTGNYKVNLYGGLNDFIENISTTTGGAGRLIMSSPLGGTTLVGGSITQLNAPFTVGTIAPGVSVDPAINIGRYVNLSTGNAHSFSDISTTTPYQFSVTGDATTDIVTISGIASIATGDVFMFSSLTGGSGLSTYTKYYARQVSGTTCKLATTNSDGTIVNFTTNITTATISRLQGFDSFDALTTIGTGVGAMDHYAGYQNRPTFNLGRIDLGYGYVSSPTFTAGFTNGTYNHVYIVDGVGASSCYYQIGLSIGNLTKGTYNTSILSVGANSKMIHVGPAIFGGTSSVSSIDANSQIHSYPAANKRGLYITNYSLTSSNSYSMIEATGTWNTTAAPSAIKVNVVDTASSANSLLLDLQIGATPIFGIGKSGSINVTKTITPSGTTGAQTINKAAGKVNFAAGASSLVVTNSLVGTNSVILATVATNDATMKTVSAVPASGFFTLYSNSMATTETAVSFLVIN